MKHEVFVKYDDGTEYTCHCRTLTDAYAKAKEWFDRDKQIIDFIDVDDDTVYECRTIWLREQDKVIRKYVHYVDAEQLVIMADADKAAYWAEYEKTIG